MNDKMIRFLKSIHITNIEDFDLDFDMIGRNRFHPEQFDMYIVKKTPWEYHLLREFQDGLLTITYPYLMKFSYIERPTILDALKLFPDWYQTLYRVPNTINPTDLNGFIHFEFKNEEEKEKHSLILLDFKSFLDFICYDFEVTSSVLLAVEEGPNYTKRELNKITKNAVKEADEALKEDTKEAEVLDSNDTKKMIEEEHRKELETIENDLLNKMKENQKAMEKERQRARLNKKGNYEPVDFIATLDTNTKSVDLPCKVFSLEIKEFAGKKKIIVGVCDKAMDAIYVNMYQNNMVNDELVSHLVRGTNIRVRGVAHVDDYTQELAIKGHYIDLLPPDEIPEDSAPIKRVELHLHSTMSTQDAVGSMDDYCKIAKAMGHTAIAITDHGVAQGYPAAQKAAKTHGLKMIYGCELYMVDDRQVYIKNPANIILNKAKYVVFDLETTGLSSRYDKIIEFGAVKVEHGVVTRSLDLLINPGRPIPKQIEEITDITQEMLNDKPTIEEVLPKIIEFIGEDTILVSHNADFDTGFLQEALKDAGYPVLTNPVIDTLALSRYLFPESRSHRLGALCRNMEVTYDEDSAHRADYDANVLNTVWQPMLASLTKNNLKMTHAELGELETPKALLKHIRPDHITVLVKNKEGLKDLYKLISLGHVEYFADVPKVPRREIEKLRSNLIIGSGCLNGEVFNAARYYNEQTLMSKMSFYDFIEVQPPENYSWLVNMGDIASQEDLLKLINDIIIAADKVGKMVCATGDVHYALPEDKVFRDVYISAKGVGGVNHPLMPYARLSGKKGQFENPDQHYRSTDEMLEAFAFLGEEKANEIVVTNTNIIADQIDKLVPLPNDVLYTPKIPNVNEMLTDMCYENAKKLYGDPLPEYIANRLEAELKGIITHGFSVIYYIAHKIVKKANDDGYLVGSRGSVGSSFVATMAGITEVNPLPPHYRCPKCKYLEWTENTYPNIKSGYDLPNKKCPQCGEELVHDGQNIPFETFLGFSAEKTPDIDLNFPGDYQARAHEYTKELLGVNNVFRAGTIETVAEKTAFGFARGYLERNGIDPNSVPRAKVACLAAGCSKIKRTTGQHPGGIVVIPDEYEVYDFTPIQYPADELDASWKTTHFDFRSIHDTVLKLDLLGHVDPMALKMMTDLTGVEVTSIPMNDPKVLSLFSKPDALGLERNYLAQETGAMAIPEFGTNFVRGILESTRPSTFSDLVIISGLSHGTDVWTGNADKLISSGKATLQEVIGCRDDIMTYLISMGLPSKVSFSIMEDVRKGKGLKPEYEEIMLAHKVPKYYIESCNLIKYMFPKGHATAYVMMAIRVGYFKIYYPLEFYATYFTVRSKQYDIATMIKGKEAIIEKYEELKFRSRNKGDNLSPKEEEILKTLSIAIEMVQRGYKFSNISIEKSDATAFVVDHANKALIPPFITLDGLGESAASSVVEARKEREFFSIEDLESRTKLNGTNINQLRELGVLKGLPESDQLSLFDFFGD